jgi:hypothetical protein
MRVNTAALKRQYRAICADNGTRPTKLGLRLFMSQARAIGRVNAKERQGLRISVVDAQRAGMPVHQEKKA